LKKAWGVIDTLLDGGIFRKAQGNVFMVLDVARVAIARSGRLGGEVECGTMIQKSFSSMKVDGQQMDQFQLTFEVKGVKGYAMASCAASVIEDRVVEIHRLTLNDSPIEVVAGESGSAQALDV